ncbi:hypothetical protein METSCH_C00610 [Metschnikowia aff. pulcherrima]|uniref:Uncharacterized protein n=1 Tax=Metschnikowia aff. pulcherrima TaxID=2163413 RepID=A0A4P6XPX1_9ASCO|nr:hypothetical protein METSCH_C00610 [Metschnikowia aff. pulcherrima]
MGVKNSAEFPMKLSNFNTFWLLVASSAAREGILTQHLRKDVLLKNWHENDSETFQLWKRDSDDDSKEQTPQIQSTERYENVPPQTTGSTNYEFAESPLIDFDSDISNEETNSAAETDSSDSDSEAVRIFKYLLSKFFAQLLLFISDDEDITQSFVGKKTALDAEMERISSLFSELSLSGNLYRSTVSRAFHITRSLHQLLVYRSALEARYVKNTISNNSDPTGTNAGVFGLNLVEFELFLFTFFRSDASLDLHAGDFASRLDSADSSFMVLKEDFENAVTPGKHITLVLGKEFDRMKGILHGLKQLHKAQKATATTSLSTAPLQKNRILQLVSPYSTTTPSAESSSQYYMDQLERDITLVKHALVLCSNNGEIDVEKYNLVKQAIKIIAKQSDEQEYPEAARAKLQQFITEIEQDTALMDGIVEANMALGQSVPNPNQLLSTQSALMEIKEIEGHVERHYQNLMRIKDYTSGFQVSVFKSAIDSQKLRVNAIASSIDTAVWDDTALLDTLRRKTQRLFKNIETLLTFLLNLRTEHIKSDAFKNYGPVFPAPSAPELEDLDTLVLEPIDKKLQDIEEGVLEFFKPTNWSVTALRVHVGAYKGHFREVLRNAQREGIRLTPLRRFKVDKITAMIVRLEEAFKEVPAVSRGDRKQ